ncbi:MAG: hypothetical protein ACYTF1_19275 [Planctomycetota bacterium]|jgi:hypothetical protein
MQMLSNVFIVLAVSTLGILVEATAEQEIHENAKRTKPNILLIGVDQMRYDTPGCNGNILCQTPNIDQL